MARSDFDNSSDERPPISAHPAFPAVVALWFAALFGLGSLVLPTVLLERAVAASGLASLLPMMSPPLDMVARGGIAVAAAVAGALAGVAIARRVAAAPARHDLSMPRRPLSVHEELGDCVTAGESTPVTRRRALAIVEHETADDPLYAAPLPGEEPYGPPAPPPAVEERFEPAEALEDPDPEEFHAPQEDRTMTDRQEFRPAPAADRFDDGGGDPLSPRHAAPDDLDLVQLVQRLGSTIERRRAWRAKAPAPAPVPPPIPETFEAAAAEDAAQAMAAYFQRGDAPPTEPDPAAGKDHDSIPFAEERDGEEDDLPDFSWPLRRAAAATPVPASWEPTALDEEDHDDAETEEDDDSGYGSLLAMRNPLSGHGQAPARFDEPASEDVEPAAAEPPLANDAWTAAQRPFEAPDAASRATAPQRGMPGDTHDALRAALATLQRMSNTG